MLKDFSVHCTVRENTFDGIRADYPRRWEVNTLDIFGFGGSSIYYRGGIHLVVWNNFMIVKDAAHVNGFAGVRVGKDSTGVVSTPLKSDLNYVGSGKQYGFFFEGTNAGTMFEQDIAKPCDVGMRFEQYSGELHSPYTEANRVTGIQAHDSNLTLSGRFRDLPVATWRSIAAADRFMPYIGRDVMNPGKALIFGGNSDPVNDPALAPSIRVGSTSPNGLFSGMPGFMFLRTASGRGRTVYVKESGMGNTGWIPVGIMSRTTAELSSAASLANAPHKYTGQQVWNSTTKRPVLASGPNPTDPWYHADGTLAHTPA